MVSRAIKRPRYFARNVTRDGPLQLAAAAPCRADGGAVSQTRRHRYSLDWPCAYSGVPIVRKDSDSPVGVVDDGASEPSRSKDLEFHFTLVVSSPQD